MPSLRRPPAPRSRRSPADHVVLHVRAHRPQGARAGAEHGVPGAGGAHAAGQHVHGRAAAHHLRRIHHHRHRHPHRPIHQRAHTAQNRHDLHADGRDAADGGGQQPDRQGAPHPQLASPLLQRALLRTRLRIPRHHQLRLLPHRLHHPLLRPRRRRGRLLLLSRSTLHRRRRDPSLSAPQQFKVLMYKNN